MIIKFIDIAILLEKINKKYEFEEYIILPVLFFIGSKTSNKHPTIEPKNPTDKKKQQFIILKAVPRTSYLFVA